MSDYISREAAIGFSDRVIERDDSNTNPVVVSFIAYRAFLRELPAADVAEVVRCRECEGWVATENSDLGLCALTKRVVTRRDYCSEGKRKDGAVE